MLNINGTVAKPKKAINKAAFKTLLLATDAAMAIYTKPQGNKPLSAPKISKEENPFFVNRSASFDFIMPNSLKNVLVMVYFKTICCGNKMANRIRTPSATDNICCKPANAKPCPTKPKKMPSKEYVKILPLLYKRIDAVL